MSIYTNSISDIQDDIQIGELSFSEIAEKYNIPFSEVELMARDLEESEVIDDDSYSEYNDDLDGDFDSAMSSAGFGTDEDYGCFETECEF